MIEVCGRRISFSQWLLTKFVKYKISISIGYDKTIYGSHSPLKILSSSLGHVIITNLLPL
jgi:ABC-type microcin C transport system permease subunit YejB